jgi:undecaprenyl-diphosphatase
MPIRYALVIGLAQCFSLWPGVSRSGTTITAALCLGLARSPAARFSFLLSIPVLLASAAYEILKAWREPAEETGTFLSLGFAMPVAFLAGLFTIHFLLRAVASNHFHRFGWYNLLAALAFSAFLLFR